MSYYKSVGIDVGIISRGINQKLDTLEEEVQKAATTATYEPDNLANWASHGGCGCNSDIDTVGKALDYLAEFRADALNRIASIEDILSRNNLS